MQLYIGNKNYSSWSMRPWVLLRHHGLDFEEVKVRFDGFQPDSAFKRRIAAISPTGKVPVLVEGDLAIWDTLAIAEYLAERHPELPLWPRGAAARAHARSYCAEMHSGFHALRSHCPQNLEATLPHIGESVLSADAQVGVDLGRVQALWTQALQTHGGPFLFGEFGIVDAYFAPVVGRFFTYALPVTPMVRDYMDRVWASPGVHAWVSDAKAEHDFIDFEEPYRQQP